MAALTTEIAIHSLKVVISVIPFQNRKKRATTEVAPFLWIRTYPKPPRLGTPPLYIPPLKRE
jgi:hypothetical protein